MKTMLQGTTPTIVFGFDNTGFTVSQITKAELTFDSLGNTYTHALSDMIVNSTNNTLSYTLTEVETLNLNDKFDAYYQLYVKIGDEIYGTKRTKCNIFQKIKGSVMD